jgi:DNA-binding transcriptional MerR regulator
MISLSSARHLVEEVIGEEITLVYTDLTLRDWAREGVISRIKVENGNALYPDIITTEILTTLKLKEKYKLSKIAEARKCLELESGHHNQITEEEIVRFVNCKKLLNDKKLVTKLSINKIESLDRIKELIDDLVNESKHLEVVGEYLKEFLQAEKDLKNMKAKKQKSYIS